jgi:hypothetical protein
MLIAVRTRQTPDGQVQEVVKITVAHLRTARDHDHDSIA